MHDDDDHAPNEGKYISNCVSNVATLIGQSESCYCYGVIHDHKIGHTRQ